MTIYRAQLSKTGLTPELQLMMTDPKHLNHKFEDFLSLGKNIVKTGDKIGADAAVRAGAFSASMLGALDKVSAYQQYASSLTQAAIIDPDSVDVHDVTIAQAEANLMLNISRNVLNRLVQGWRDVINTR